MRCRSGRRRLLGAGRFWPSRVGLRGKRVARSLRGLGAKRLLAHLHTILYMRACVIGRLADSNLSPRRIIINPSSFANNPACRGAVRRFFAQQKTADPSGSSCAPWLLIFNCLKEPKSRIVAPGRTTRHQDGGVEPTVEFALVWRAFFHSIWNY